MSLSSVKRLWSSRLSRSDRRPRRAGVSLNLEALEARWLPNATVITVTTAADDPTTPIAGQTTLRDAINQANQTTGATIQFAQGLNGQTIQPLGALPAITGAGTTIDGMGMNITLDGSKSGTIPISLPAPDGPPFPGLFVTAGNVTIEGLTIANWGGAGVTVDEVNNSVSNTNILNNDLENNGFEGVFVFGESEPGSPSATNVNIVGNTISGNGYLATGYYPTGDDPGCGVLIEGDQNVVKGNDIYGNKGNGVTIWSSQNVVTGNDINGNQDGNGVEVHQGSQNTIQGNFFSGNSGLGILLDPGANNSITAPALTSWISNGSGGSIVEGQLTPPAGAPSGFYTVEFFANTPSGNPQGGQFLGSIQVMANGGATTTFAFAVPSTFSGGSISATVTDPSGDTSQFSNALSPPQDPPSDPPAAAIPTTPPPSAMQAAITLFLDGAEMLFDDLAAYANPNLAAVNASIVANLPYAGQFAGWFVLAGEMALAEQLSATK